MAGINVENVNIPNDISAGVPFQVRVEANNRNVWVDPFSDNTCEPSGQYVTEDTTGGQPGRIKVEVYDSGGNKIEEEGWIEFCAPTDAPGRPDPVIPFDFEINEGGNFNVKVIIEDDIGGGHRDTDTRSVRVDGNTSGGGSGGSGGGSGGDNGSGGDSGDGNRNGNYDTDGDGIPDRNDPYPNDPQRPSGGTSGSPIVDRVKEFASENPKLSAAVGLYVGVKMMGSGGGGDE